VDATTVIIAALPVAVYAVCAILVYNIIVILETVVLLVVYFIAKVTYITTPPKTWIL